MNNAINESNDEFEDARERESQDSDLLERDPFDISKALEGAALERLSPDVKRFVLHSDFEPAGDQPKAIEKLILNPIHGIETLGQEFKLILILRKNPSVTLLGKSLG